VDSGWLRVVRGGSWAKAPPLAARPVAGYTNPFLFLFERAQQLTPLTTKGKPWWLRVQSSFVLRAEGWKERKNEKWQEFFALDFQGLRLIVAFITWNSNLVPLLEGLWSSNTCRFDFAVFWQSCALTNWASFTLSRIWNPPSKLHALKKPKGESMTVWRVYYSNKGKRERKAKFLINDLKCYSQQLKSNFALLLWVHSHCAYAPQTRI